MLCNEVFLLYWAYSFSLLSTTFPTIPIKRITYYCSHLHTVLILLLHLYIPKSYDTIFLISRSYYIFDTYNIIMLKYLNYKDTLIYIVHHIFALYFLSFPNALISYYFVMIEVSNVSLLITYHVIHTVQNVYIIKLFHIFEFLWYGFFRCVIPILTRKMIYHNSAIIPNHMYFLSFIFYIFGIVWTIQLYGRIRILYLF